MTPQKRRELAEKNVYYMEGFKWITYLPCDCPPGTPPEDCDGHEIQYFGDTREKAIENAVRGGG